MNSLKYKSNPQTKAFLKLWFSYGVILMIGDKLVTDWNQIDWSKVEVEVFKLQKRIFRASQSGDVAKVHKLQRLLLRSWNARLLAIRRISQDNQGKNTAGIDGVKTLTQKED
jgi:RNA-directed DNA polymerase (EC 2.7.7.49)